LSEFLYFLARSIYIYIYKYAHARARAVSDIYCACDISCNIFLLVFFEWFFFTVIIIVVYYFFSSFFFIFCSRTHTTITIEFGGTQHITMGIRRDRVSRLFRRSPRPRTVQLQDGRCNDSTRRLPVHILTQIRESGRLSRRNVGRAHYTRQCTLAMMMMMIIVRTQDGTTHARV